MFRDAYACVCLLRSRLCLRWLDVITGISLILATLSGAQCLARNALVRGCSIYSLPCRPTVRANLLRDDPFQGGVYDVRLQHGAENAVRSVQSVNAPLFLHFAHCVLHRWPYAAA